MAIDYRAVEAANAEPEAEARLRIGAFLQRFSLVHFDLACHAAAPMMLTPDLAYQLWVQFTPPNTPWTAVSDVLLSSLCTDAGHEAYRMGPTTRRLLLQKLEQKHTAQRLKDLTEFLLVYAEQAAKDSIPNAEARAQAEMVNALALSNADDAEAEFLALASERVGQGQSLRTVSLNLLNLLHQLPGEIAGRRREVVEQLPVGVRAEMGLVEAPGAKAKNEGGTAFRIWNFDVVLKATRDRRSNIESLEVSTTSEVTGLTDHGFSMQRKKQPPAKTEVLVTPTFLRNYLVKHFSLEEIKLFSSEMNNLAPTLGKKLVENLDADNIGGSTKMAYAQGLVQFLERRTLLELLVALLSSKQAFVDDPFPTSTIEQAEALYEAGNNTVSLDQVATLTKMLMLNTTQAEDQRTLGQSLRQMFFTSAGISNLAESLRPKRIGLQGRLRIRIQTDDPFLLSLPWELICFTQEDQELTELAQPFLGLNPQVSIVRYSRSHEAEENLSALNLGVFYIAAFFANPHGMPPLNLKQDEQNLREAVESAAQFKYFGFNDDWSQKDLAESLRSMDANIFHFSGHGQFVEQKTSIDSGSIYLRNEPTLAQPLESDALASMLRGADARLAVINAAYSARRSSRGPDRTPVGELTKFIPAVVGMQLAIKDDIALAFTRTLYTWLAEGWPVDSAVTQARIAMYERAERASNDWVAPVLYLSVKEDVAFFPRLVTTNKETHTLTPKEERQDFFITMQRMLNERFSRDELHALFFDLGSNFESIVGRSKGAKIKGILDYSARRGHLQVLVEHCRKVREMFVWPDAPITPEIPATESDKNIEQNLVRLMSLAFSREELRMLCSDIGIRETLIRFDVLETAAVAIMEQCRSANMLGDLVQWCRKERPDAAWPKLTNQEPVELDGDAKERRYLTNLRAYLIQRYNREEFRPLAFAAGADVAALDWSRGIEIIVLDVIQQLSQQGDIGSLVYQATRERSSVPPPAPPSPIVPAGESDVARIDRRLRLMDNFTIFFPAQLQELCKLVGCDFSDIDLADGEGAAINALIQRLIYWSDDSARWAQLKQALFRAKPERDWNQFDLSDTRLDDLGLSARLREALERMSIFALGDLLDLVESGKDRLKLPHGFDKKLEKELVDKLTTSGWLEKSTRRTNKSAKSKIRSAKRKK